MPAQWTADLVGKMHMHGITAKQLAEKVGWNAKYLSVILNGHRNPKNAEQRLTTALSEILEIKEEK